MESICNTPILRMAPSTSSLVAGRFGGAPRPCAASNNARAASLENSILPTSRRASKTVLVILQSSRSHEYRSRHLVTGIRKRPDACSLSWQHAAAHQIFVGLTGGFAALGDGRDDQVGAETRVAGDKDPGVLRAVTVLRTDGTAVGVAEVHFFEEAVAHRSREADGEQNEVRLYLEVRAIYANGLAVRSTLGLDGVHLLDVTIETREARDGDGEAAFAALLVGGVGVQDERPVRPGEFVGVLGRLGAVGEDLD